MLTNSRMGSRALVGVVLTMVVSLSERAQAQQSGLFPLAPIRRQRPPCDQEDPVYKIYKHQYFGYHPTCWRRFPDGWGCPSPEAPDRERSFRERKLGGEEEPSGEEARPGEGVTPPPGGRAPTPSVPEGRSPFEMDTPNGRTGVAPLPPAGGQPPRATPPQRGERSPFDTPDPGAAVSPRRNPLTRRTASTAGETLPELAAPTGQPESSTGRHSTQDDPDEDAPSPGDDGPLLAMPNIELPRGEDSGSLLNSQPGEVTAPAPSPAVNTSVSAPPSAPRRGRLSNLFSGLGLNWLRR
jgi:hypothetical protein